MCPVPPSALENSPKGNSNPAAILSVKASSNGSRRDSEAAI
jgi:hypothetical protein